MTALARLQGESGVLLHNQRRLIEKMDHPFRVHGLGASRTITDGAEAAIANFGSNLACSPEALVSKRAFAISSNSARSPTYTNRSKSVFICACQILKFRS